MTITRAHDHLQVWGHVHFFFYLPSPYYIPISFFVFVPNIALFFYISSIYIRSWGTSRMGSQLYCECMLLIHNHYVLAFHRKLQEDLTDEMVDLARELKERSLLMSQSVKNTEKVSLASCLFHFTLLWAYLSCKKLMIIIKKMDIKLAKKLGSSDPNLT